MSTADDMFYLPRVAPKETMNIEQVGETIRAAIRKARAEGIEIRSSTLGSRRQGHCCMLGALVLDSQSSEEERYTEATGALGLFENDWSALALGFDTPAGVAYQDSESRFDRLWELAQTIRAEVDRGEL